MILDKSLLVRRAASFRKHFLYSISELCEIGIKPVPWSQTQVKNNFYLFWFPLQTSLVELQASGNVFIFLYKESAISSC